MALDSPGSAELQGPGAVMAHRLELASEAALERSDDSVAEARFALRQLELPGESEYFGESERNAPSLELVARS